MEIKTECEACDSETVLYLDTREVEALYDWGTLSFRPAEGGQWVKWNCPHCDDAQAYFLSEG